MGGINRDDRQEHAGDTAPDALSDVPDVVNARLWELITSGTLGPVGEAVLATPGKRVRATLLLASAEVVDPGMMTDSAVLDMACAVEMLHEASLVHDDICDRSDARRGLPSMPARFGIRYAAFAGFDLAGAALRTLGQVLERRPEFRVRLDLAPPDAVLVAHLSELSAGQILEGVPPLRDPAALRRHYRSVAQAKTGTLFRLACSFGGLVAGATDAQVTALNAFAQHFALAFQVMDDVRDVEGSIELGKLAGTDVVNHVPSWPLIEWLDTTPDAAARWDISRSTGLDSAQAESLLQEVIEAGCTERSRALVREEVDAACTCLTELPPNLGRDVLACLVGPLGDA